MAAEALGILDWGVTLDEAGHREYTLKALVTALTTEGPSAILGATGLPTLGSTWVYGGTDTAATCRNDWKVSTVLNGEPNEDWIVEIPFRSKPIETCADINPGSPLLEPPEIGGTFTKYRRQARLDKNGDPLWNAALEPITGEIAEIEDPRPTVRISQNVSALDLATVTAILRNAPLNSSTLWGVAARYVKFSNYTFTRKYFGACSVYYTEELEFEVDEFDRWYTQQGYRKRKTGAPSPPTAYNHVEIIRNENDLQPQLSYLDANANVVTTPVETKLEILDASNLLLLGIPASLA